MLKVTMTGTATVSSFDNVAGAREAIFTLGLSSVRLCVNVNDQLVKDSVLDADQLFANGVTFVGCSFDDVDLDRCFVRNCHFIGCDLSGATWPSTEDLDSVFENCSFDESCNIGWDGLAVLRCLRARGNTFTDKRILVSGSDTRI